MFELEVVLLSGAPFRSPMLRQFGCVHFEVAGACLDNIAARARGRVVSSRQEAARLGPRSATRQRLLAQQTGGMARWMCNARSIVVRSSARDRSGTWGSSASTGST